MKIGIALEGIRAVASLARLAARIEALGFDSLWAPDHVAFSQPICDPFQVLAACAATTSRIRLGTCVLLLPLRHPTHVAKAASSLDWFCGGRLTLGIGIGGEFPEEFAACEVPVAERGGRANEALPILRALWRGEDPPTEGRYFHVPRTKLAPAPAQAGGPPVWIGGRSEAALRRAAWLGDGYLGYFLDAEGIRARMERIRELRREAPAARRRGEPITAALMAFARVDDVGDEARDRARRRLGAMYGKETAAGGERFCVAGTAGECRDRLAALAAAGVDHLLFSPIADEGGNVEDQLERLAALL